MKVFLIGEDSTDVATVNEKKSKGQIPHRVKVAQVPTIQLHLTPSQFVSVDLLLDNNRSGCIRRYPRNESKAMSGVEHQPWLTSTTICSTTTRFCWVQMDRDLTRVLIQSYVTHRVSTLRVSFAMWCRSLGAVRYSPEPEGSIERALFIRCEVNNVDIRYGLPPLSFWMWEPRSYSHIGGGWSLESHPDRNSDRPVIVTLLLSGFRTLDREVFASAFNQLSNRLISRVVRRNTKCKSASGTLR